jgi:hypothetical protein
MFHSTVRTLDGRTFVYTAPSAAEFLHFMAKPNVAGDFLDYDTTDHVVAETWATRSKQYVYAMQTFDVLTAEK